MTSPAQPEESLGVHPGVAMTPRRRGWLRSALLLPGLAALGLSLGIAWPRAGETTAARPAPTPMQVMADVALIDARCKGLSVDFGALFRYGEANGIPAVAVLPLGRLRKAFEAAYARRASASPDDLCTGVAEEDAEIAPGVLRQR